MHHGVADVSGAVSWCDFAHIASLREAFAKRSLPPCEGCEPVLPAHIFTSWSCRSAGRGPRSWPDDLVRAQSRRRPANIHTSTI